MWNEIVQVVWIEWMMVLRRWKRGGIPSLLENHQTNNNDDGDHDNARNPAAAAKAKEERDAEIKRGKASNVANRFRSLARGKEPAMDDSDDENTGVTT